MNLFYNNFKGYWVKSEIICGGGILKVSPAPAFPMKILIMHIQHSPPQRHFGTGGWEI